MNIRCGVCNTYYDSLEYTKVLDKLDITVRSRSLEFKSGWCNGGSIVAGVLDNNWNRSKQISHL